MSMTDYRTYNRRTSTPQQMDAKEFLLYAFVGFTAYTLLDNLATRVHVERVMRGQPRYEFPQQGYWTSKRMSRLWA